MPEECASGTDALTQPGPDCVLDLLWPSTRVEYWCKNFIGYTVKSLCIQTIPWVMLDKWTKLWKLHIWINTPQNVKCIKTDYVGRYVKHLWLPIFGPNTRYHSNQQCYLAVASFFILLHFLRQTLSQTAGGTIYGHESSAFLGRMQSSFLPVVQRSSQIRWRGTRGIFKIIERHLKNGPMCELAVLTQQ